MGIVMEQLNLLPLRMIRIALNLNIKQMAECFDISSYYYRFLNNS